ncbi:Glutamate receptor 2.2 [Vitis vinifera]|uniref:Glutamate receptor 2.2 n=1 Tax=Vitis vinifera TaxID=29760 RepID=A0A438BTW5_VITVI|nr:Glutamate receptor 2.2 [Vitis vinifera]
MMEEGYVWILTDGLTDLLSTLDPLVIDSMQGVLGIKPHVPRTKELENFRVRWKRKFQQDHPKDETSELNIFGLWAYDAASALAMAVEKVGATNLSFQKTNISSNSTDLDTIGVSQIGPKLLQSLLSTKFKGLSGDFQIFDGQLHPTAFQIVNVIGKGERGIGFWTPKNGIIRRLKFTNANSNTYSTSKDNLGAIVWPGEPTYFPKGWVLPVNEKKLKIGVPVKDGFSEFVKVTWDPNTNATKVAGYCIDVFDAVMSSLPYAVPYEYIPFGTPDGKPAGNYNDLLYQVFLKKYDAVVGDTTIVANRSNYVDFTLPYTESGVSMIVPIKDNKSKSAWIFLKPLTWGLWVTSACFFVFIGFVIWVLEHRINEDFRGPPSHQAGTIFWFSFSTMVFAQRENCEQLGSVCDDHMVLCGAHPHSKLHRQLDLNVNRPTAPANRYRHKRAKSERRSANGGIAAAFDEIPYMKLFIAQHCSKYTMVQPTYKYDGFGFVSLPKRFSSRTGCFKGSLNVTEGDEMVRLRKSGLGKKLVVQMIMEAQFLLTISALIAFGPFPHCWSHFIFSSDHRIPDEPYSGSTEPMAAVGASPSVTNCSPRPSTFSNQTINDISSPETRDLFFRARGGQSSTTPSRQSSPVIVPAVELVDLNQERTNIPPTSH